MSDLRLIKFAQILVDYSTCVKPGEKVAITSSTIAEPFIRELYTIIIERGAYPHVLFDIPGQDEIYQKYANDAQLDFVPIFHRIAFEEFDVLLKIRAETNTRGMSTANLERQSRRQKALSTLLSTQLQRGAAKSLRWMSTLFPTNAYAMEADMGLAEYEDFAFQAIHADELTSDPVSHWQKIKAEQNRIIEQIQGHDRIELHGPNVELSLSIKDRTFNNGCGEHNMPDGEIYTGPVEDSLDGWVRYTYPAIYQNREVDGVELHFEKGRVVKASASKNQDFLIKMLDTDAGSRYVGEFAIGTNKEINRFTRNILFDEKIGGSFHTALGAGYPETGSLNRSLIHWDMICDMGDSSEILVDGQFFYKDGKFLI